MSVNIGAGPVSQNGDITSDKTMKTVFALISAFSLVLANLAGATNETTKASSDPLLTREYKIKPDAFVRSLKQLEAANPNDPAESNQALLVRYFKNKQVVVAKPGTVILDEKGNRLIVRTTKAQQEKIQKLFEIILINSSLPPPPAYAIVDPNLGEQPAIDFKGAPVASVLDIYRELMDAELDMQLPPEVLMGRITLQSKPKIAGSEAAQLIEIALREQAGVVVTRVDEKHLKATFDKTVKKKQGK